MTDFLTVVERFSAEVTAQTAWAGRQVTEAVLTALAAVPFDGDVDTYIERVVPVVRASFEAAMQPTLDAALAEHEAVRAKLAALLVEKERTDLAFEEFRKVKASKTVH